MADRPTTDAPRRARRPLAAGAAAVGIAALAIGATSPAHADAPVKDGWWTNFDQGSVAGSPALDGSPALGVPSGGLYVANAGASPNAISALTFTVPEGATVGDLTLAITGSPQITSPPVACAVSANTLNYQPAQGGPMNTAPTPDCTATVTGKVNTGQTSVTFAASKFLANGSVAMIIEAGGPADSITFSKPDSGALQVTPAPSTTDAAAAATPSAPSDPTQSAASSSAGPAAPTPAASSAASGPSPSAASSASSSAASPEPVASVGTSSAAAALPSTGDASAAAALPAPTSPAAPTPPAGAPGGAAAPSGPPTSPIAAKPAAAHQPSKGRRHAAEIFGIGAVLVALVAWTEGFGILGGRVRTIGSTRRNEGVPEGIAAQ